MKSTEDVADYHKLTYLNKMLHIIASLQLSYGSRKPKQSEHDGQGCC